MIKLQSKCQEKHRERKDHIKSWGVPVVLSVRTKTFKKILFKKKKSITSTERERHAPQLIKNRTQGTKLELRADPSLLFYSPQFKKDLQ